MPLSGVPFSFARKKYIPFYEERGRNAFHFLFFITIKKLELEERR
jgi:hypothetical protein